LGGRVQRTGERKTDRSDKAGSIAREKPKKKRAFAKRRTALRLLLSRNGKEPIATEACIEKKNSEALEKRTLKEKKKVVAHRRARERESKKPE